jgi:hypothetical protein
MAFVFQIKRRLAGDPGPPTFLQPGELAFNEVDNTLYIGTEGLSTISGELSTTTDPASGSSQPVL